MKLLSFLFLLIGFSLPAFTQTDPITQVHGARSQGMGNMRVHGNDAWSYFNNPGGLSTLEESQVSVGVDQRFGLKDLSTVDLVSAWKLPAGTLGVGVSSFGGKLFNQQSLGLAFSNRLGIVNLGAKLEWFQTQMQGFGTGNSLIFSFGGIAELSPELSFGASIFNLNRAKLSSESVYRLPTGISMAIRYTPNEDLELQLELEKDIQINPVVKLGMEYGLKEWLYLRTGINSNPGRLFFGFGLAYGRFQMDYAQGQNLALGTSHHLNLGMKLTGK